MNFFATFFLREKLVMVIKNYSIISHIFTAKRQILIKSWFFIQEHNHTGFFLEYSEALKRAVLCCFAPVHENAEAEGVTMTL